MFEVISWGYIVAFSHYEHVVVFWKTYEQDAQGLAGQTCLLLKPNMTTAAHYNRIRGEGLASKTIGVSYTYK